MADGLLRLLALSAGERVALGAQARDRVRIEFTLARMAQRYGAVWEDVAGPS